MTKVVNTARLIHVGELRPVRCMHDVELWSSSFCPKCPTDEPTAPREPDECPSCGGICVPFAGATIGFHPYPSGRPNCTGCGKPIAEGESSVGVSAGEASSFHAGCYQQTQQTALTNWLNGFTDEKIAGLTVEQIDALDRFLERLSQRVNRSGDA